MYSFSLSVICINSFNIGLRLLFSLFQHKVILLAEGTETNLFEFYQNFKESIALMYQNLYLLFPQILSHKK